MSSLEQERIRINKKYRQFYDHIIPESVPMSLYLPYSFVADYAGVNLVEAQSDFTLLREAWLDLCEKLNIDKVPFSLPMVKEFLPAEPYQVLESRIFQMGKSGIVQHPEVSAMEAEEYPELIDHPFDFIIEKVIPRQYAAMNPKKPFEMAFSLLRMQQSLDKIMGETLPILMEINAKRPYYQSTEPFAGVLAPFDFISNWMRGFTNMTMDLRRHRTQITEACEAILPMIIQWGVPANCQGGGMVSMPLHMPTFMRTKDFEEIYLPTFKTEIEQFVACGLRPSIFCEDDWTRYLDYIQDWPAGCELTFEKGDPGQIKDKLGDKFILNGLYPIALLRTGTCQECIDKAKELLDIMMPGGGYVFGFDKGPISKADINIENLAAVLDFVNDYGHYDNAGEAYGQKLNSEGFVKDKRYFKPVASKYLTDWPEYREMFPLVSERAKKNLEDYDRTIMKFFLGFLI